MMVYFLGCWTVQCETNAKEIGGGGMQGLKGSALSLTEYGAEGMNRWLNWQTGKTEPLLGQSGNMLPRTPKITVRM